uniref:Uncharacterized protein n=1 Tax=Daphnia galeata TaxID=27404 RepID=A0A8J2RJE5_9CRUS|nr:unnamed protein product [Daphnia galeata]
MLRDFATQDRCVGISDPAFKDLVRVATASHLHEPEYDTKIWRAKNCHLLAATDSAICVECKLLLPALVMSRYRATKTGKVLRIRTKEELQYALNQATRKITVLEKWNKRAIARLKSLKAEVCNIRLKLAESAKTTTLQHLTKNMKTPMDPNAKLTLQTILARAQVQNKHGMHCEAQWLLECLLLRIKSVAAYEHIRRLKLLPLPSCSTLRRLLSGVSCHFGFNTAALKAVEKIVEGKSGKDLSVILTFDEIALTPQPNFTQESLAIDGFVNLSIPVYNRDEMEHHDEVQPFGVFASAGAASGDDLHRLVIAAIIRLEARGVRCQGELTPHQLIAELYATDAVFGEGAACPKLRLMHINPTSFQKMNVSLAMQVLSSSVAKGLEYYRTCPKIEEEVRRKFVKCKPVEELLQLLNECFDTKNTRRLRDGIKKEKWQEKKEMKLPVFPKPKDRTQSFYQGVARPKLPPPFVSKDTIKALRITIRSIIDLIELLLSPSFNLTYSLSAKFNQDCLEVFWDHSLSGGAQNKQTASSFLQLFRMLSLYYPTKTILRGCNVDGEEKMEMLTSYMDWLVQRFKDNVKVNKSLKDYMKDLLLTNMKVDHDNNSDFDVDVSAKNQNLYFKSAAI